MFPSCSCRYQLGCYRPSGGRLAADWRPTGGRLAADWRPTGGRLAADWRPTGGRLAADWRPTGGRLAADWRPTGGRVVAEWRPSGGRVAVVRSPRLPRPFSALTPLLPPSCPPFPSLRPLAPLAASRHSPPISVGLALIWRLPSAPRRVAYLVSLLFTSRTRPTTTAPLLPPSPPPPPPSPPPPSPPRPPDPTPRLSLRLAAPRALPNANKTGHKRRVYFAARARANNFMATLSICVQTRKIDIFNYFYRLEISAGDSI